MTQPNQPRNLPANQPSRALAPQPSGDLMLPPGISRDDTPPEIKALAVRIAANSLAKNETITAAQALAAAFHFFETGEVLGRHAYVGTGKLTGQVLEGYRGVARKLNMSKYQWRYRAPSEQEKQDHHIGAQDRMVICELTDLVAYAAAKRNGLDYQPIIGISIVRQGDKVNSPAYRDSRWIMEKQARVDALRQVGENTSTEDVLAEAEANGIDMSEIRDAQAQGAWLNAEQAEVAVDQQLARQTIQQLTPEEQRIAGSMELAPIDLKNQLGDWAYACAIDDQNLPCPSCGVLYNEKAHTAECAFRLIKPDLALYPPPAPEAPRELPPHLQAVEPIRQQLMAEASKATGPATAKQREWNAKTLAALTADEAERVAVLDWAFGPTEDLTEGMARALYAWAQPVKALGGAFTVTGKAVKEWPEVVAALKTELDAPIE